MLGGKPHVFLGSHGHVTYVDPALDQETHAGRAHPVPGDHRLHMITLPLHTNGQVLKQALDRLQPHMQTGTLLPGKEVWMAKSLLPFGSFLWVGPIGRPCFVCLMVMHFHMRKLAEHCRSPWTQLMARRRRGSQDYFLPHYFPMASLAMATFRPHGRLPCGQVARDRRGGGARPSGAGARVKPGAALPVRAGPYRA